MSANRTRFGILWARRAARALACAVPFGVVPPLAAQGPPPTDIYVVPLAQSGERLQFGAPVNITRRVGYDNQPSFAPDGQSLYYTAIYHGQADTYRYDRQTGTITRITSTDEESEYSPALMPDGFHLSVLKVERDSSQRIWRYDLTGDAGRMVLGHARPIGYYAWGNAYTLAVFLLGKPTTLQLVDLRTEAAFQVADHVGRTVLKAPNRSAVSFLHGVNGDTLIREVDLVTREIRTLAPAVSGQEYYTWMPDGSLLMAQASKLFRWRRPGGTEWEEVADFESARLRGISRLAVSPAGDAVALVADEPAVGGR